jgi:hypothetical protein
VLDGKNLLSIKRAHVFRYSEFVRAFEQKRCPASSREANTTVMADDFACVMYAIESNNQPRSRGD